MSRSLLMLSGGIDSALVMYKELSAGRRLRLHHIRFQSHEGRRDVEQRAVERILAWHRKRGLTDFTYSESVFEYGDIRFIVKDRVVWTLFMAILLADKKNTDIERVLVPSHRDAWGTGKKIEPLVAKSDRFINGMVQLIAGRTPRLEKPLLHMTKADIIAETPPGLLECCWWCRKPQKGKVCNKCFTCKQVNAARVVV